MLFNIGEGVVRAKETMLGDEFVVYNNAVEYKIGRYETIIYDSGEIVIRRKDKTVARINISDLKDSVTINSGDNNISINLNGKVQV